MSAEEERDLAEFNRKYEDQWDKLAIEPIDDLASTDAASERHIRFMNSTRGHIIVMWINYQGHSVPYARLAPRQYFDIYTFCTHPWVGRFEENGDLCEFRLGPDPDYSNHKIYVSERPAPPTARGARRVFLTQPNKTSLQEASLHAVAALIDYDTEKASTLSIPRSVQEELIAWMNRRARLIRSLPALDNQR